MADEERAKALHDSILNKVKAANFDTFGEFSDYDAFRNDCLFEETQKLKPQEAIVKSYEHYLQKTSTYWRKWKRENDRLEYISAKTLDKPKRPKRKAKIRGAVLTNARAHKFSTSEDHKTPEFDLIGPTNVNFLMKLTKKGLPTIAGLPAPNTQKASSSNKFGYGVMGSTSSSRPKLPGLVSLSEPSYDADKYLRPNIGCKFQTARRFPDSAASSSSNSAPPPAPTSAAVFSLPGGQFSVAVREISDVQKGESAKDSAPGPGSYSIPSFTDEAKHHNKGATFYPRRADPADLIGHSLKPSKKNPYKTMRPSEFAKTVVFGFGCSREEHVMYGMCLDGKCGKRAFFEGLMVDMQDSLRISGDKIEAERMELTRELGILTRSSSYNDSSSDVHRDDQHDASLTPLHVATLKEDLHTIQILSTLDTDPNAIESKHGRSPLHIAVIRNYAKVVSILVDLFQGRIDLDIKDSNGDSALHIAARAGKDNIVEILCDGGASPLCGKNLAGKNPVDEAKTHKAFQLLKITSQKQELLNEYNKLSRSIKIYS